MKSRAFALPTSLGIILAAMACGSSSGPSAPSQPVPTPTPTPTPNRPPVIGTATASPAIGLQASTAITFSASATDPDGDALQYRWTFGDGETLSGQTVTHTYQRGGMMTAGVAVSDGSATTTTDTPVSIVSLSGIWFSPDPCGGSGPLCAYEQGRYLTLTQTGSSVTGSHQVFTLRPVGDSVFVVNPVRGVVTTSAPRITLDVTGMNASGGVVPLCFTLEPNGDVTALSGELAGGVCGGVRLLPQARNPFVRTNTVPHP